ncbi:acetyl-CoA synthetase-like protein [Lophiostoma macrostomum CBS 122681]|uniref:Acetyl-CoA synthetase-like protein n=1 Tax=Lophiostoma macrostomum CBS 122681 TaxID=1314788 RepID=A0A6A6SQW2_9PLEO|nr:acetyl-CoA synthetase-like protein [Lophiostoma macrostomum CBS 122681]
MGNRYGSRLMPIVVDEIAKHQPDLVYASVPVTTNVNEGFREITFSEIASATNCVAAWISRSIGRSSNFDTIAYMGLVDLRYVVVFLAAVKCGYKVLLPSVRNSAWMNASLLNQTECSHLLFAKEVDGLVGPLMEHRPDLHLHPIESLETLVQPDIPDFPWERHYDEAKWDPILILHSSGSTGPPRPIYMNHATFAVGDNDRNLPTVPGRVNQNWSLWDSPQGTKEHFFSPFPPFHLAGFSSMVMLPIYYSNASLVLGPPTRPATGQLVSEIMDHFTLRSIFCPPIIAEQLVQAGGLDKCKSLKFLLYAGGPLSQETGDALSKVTDVCQFYGQTETGAIQALVPRRENWASLEWHPMQEAIMEPFLNDKETFELIMHRNSELERVRSISCNFPDVDVWRTKDLFNAHPTKPGLWRFHGRADDIIVLSNGEKFNPVPSEMQIAAHPLVTGALIIGNGHPQASLILEPKDYTEKPTTVIEEVWPVVEKANLEAPGHARITKNMILVGSKDKPFQRSPKGTIVRETTRALYEKAIAELMSRGTMMVSKHQILSSSPDITSILQFVQDIVASAFPGHEFDDEDDLFVLGLDSLQTTEIISQLKAGVSPDGQHQEDLAWITVKFVYEHPSVRSLSEAIRDHLASGEATSSITKSSYRKSEEMMQRMIKEYTHATGETPTPSQSISEPQSGLHVVLTGSTGSLGTQLLVKLVFDPRVFKISCLDRSANARERVTNAVSTWPQPPGLDRSHIVFHQVDFSKTDFGLPETTFAELRDTTNIVIHSAWTVDFNHSLSSFEAVHIRGIRNFIQFSASSMLNPRIIFISSISSVGNWHSAISAHKQSDANHMVVPETIAPTPTVAQPIGYAESKAVAEQLLAAATKSGYIKASIIRVGQIAGCIDEQNGGKWNEHEWFPLLLKTSKALGKIPDASMMDKIDWVPIDILAAIVSDLIWLQDQQALEVFHLVNPSPTTWAELLPAIQACLGDPEATSMEEWVSELENVDRNDPAKPAVKILGFFRDMQRSKYIGAKDLKFSTSNAEKVSSRLEQIGPIQADWITRWIKDWEL